MPFSSQPPAGYSAVENIPGCWRKDLQGLPQKSNRHLFRNTGSPSVPEFPAGVSTFCPNTCRHWMPCLFLYAFERSGTGRRLDWCYHILILCYRKHIDSRHGKNISKLHHREYGLYRAPPVFADHKGKIL